MPWYDDLQESENHPIDWEIIDEILGIMRADFGRWIIETKDDALNDAYTELSTEKIERHFENSIIRYRETDDQHMLLEFHDLALSRLSKVTALVDDRKINHELLYQWGILSACHGYILNSSLALSSDLALEVNRRLAGKTQGIESQLKWYAHWRHRYRKTRRSATVANRDFIQIIFDILGDVIPTPAGFSKGWFRRCLAKNIDGELKFELTSTMRKLKIDDDRYRKLLSSDPRRAPLIPPLSRAAFKKKNGTP